MITLRTFAEVRAAVSGSVALVPTMGFLHEGHLSLISAAADVADTTVVSLFVNPTQFGDDVDLDAYPRNEERDAALSQSVGADILFAPSAEEVYPEGKRVTVHVGGVGDAMEGRFRHGHFEGVATVVAKLFAGIEPDHAFFGKKDAQQLAVVRTMRSGLRFAVRIHGMPTVRERDGLALSSRNTRLTPADRQDAISLSRALFAAADAIESGMEDASRIRATARSVIEDMPGVELEYVEVADAHSAAPVETIVGDSFVAIAARVGGVRLIDNVVVEAETMTVDRGIMLNHQSILYEEARSV
ncbi:MAG: pantoate--beta-alanine ligase [Acidimicrobiia bacterium]|nr:pantoate--beta-alanine ligase [Acidimicrobiia bacterium]